MSDAPPASSPSLLTSFGTGLLVATLGAAIAALPAAQRSSADVGFASAWLVLWGSLTLVVAPAAGALRLARPLPPLASSLPLGLALALGPVIVFARVLKVTTHHRPLGAATFAIVAAGVVLGAVTFAARAIAWSRAKSGALRALPLVAGLGGLALGALLALPAARPPLAGYVLDGALAATVLAVAAFAPIPDSFARRARVAGLAGWLVVAALGLVMPASRPALSEHAPALMGLAAWLR